jgi:quercetin dioxygenase-like cupin family protein
MIPKTTSISLIVDPGLIEWAGHPRFDGIAMKTLINSAGNPLAGVNLVHVPPGGIIGRHHHVQETETVYVLVGQSTLTLADTDFPFAAGQIVAIPAGLEHALRNNGLEGVELLCIFTPPLS